MQSLECLRFLVVVCIAQMAFTCTGEEPITNFAKRQIDQMVEDRPDMRHVLTLDDPLYKSVAHEFDVGNTHQRVHWFPLEPERDASAQHGADGPHQPAFVKITSNSECTGEDRWLLLVFELHNLQNAWAFRKLQKMAIEATLTEDQFAERSLLLELRAQIETKHTLQRLVPPDHRLARTKGFLHFMALPDREPVEITEDNRINLKANLDHAREWYRLVVVQRGANISARGD